MTINLGSEAQKANIIVIMRCMLLIALSSFLFIREKKTIEHSFLSFP